MRGDFPWVEILSVGACFVSRELTTENPSRLAGRVASCMAPPFRRREACFAKSRHDPLRKGGGTVVVADPLKVM